LRGRCLERDYIDFIPKYYVITYCNSSYVIWTIKSVTVAVTDGQLPFRDTMYSAYVYVRWLPDDGWDSQPKHVGVYKLIVQ
jgi:hypothetical protein